MEKVPKSTINTLIIVIAVIIVSLIILPYIGENPSEENTVEVQGTNSLKVNPDLVSVYFNVETKADTSEEAENLNSEKTENLTQEIIDLGFNEEDLKTENYNIRPNYEYDNGKRERVGYIASHSLKISFSSNKTDLIGKVIDAGAESGAGISYISFELSQELRQASKSEAIKLASQDARIKAESIAQGFDKSIGDLKQVSLNEFYYQPWRLYDSGGVSSGAEKAKQAVSNITPSEKEVSASVTAIYELR